MLSNLGYFSLIFGCLFCLTSIYQSIKLIYKDSSIVSRNLNFCILFQIFFILLSFIILTFAFIISDFSNETVFSNSHTTKPLFYKISGVWGNHEGSLLLWLLVLIFFLLLFVVYSKNENTKYRLLTIMFQEIIILGFFLFIIFTSNPFNYIFPIPSEGLGLNPILQDPALAIHPPILYIGYVGTSIIFSSSLAACVNKSVNSIWANSLKKWVFLSWIFLTLGIMIGSIWAYYELGWGGFWFWDPVENVSLMPWFCLTALLHTTLVLDKRNDLKNWTIILSIATFSLSISGTFLVRSGILNSIHTFANDPTRGLFILIFLLVLIIISLSIFFIYFEDNKQSKNIYNLYSKEIAILINNWFMMYFLSVVLIGTVYPIFLEVINNSKISVGPPFYHKLLIPFLIPFFIFMSFGPRLKWIKDNIFKVNYSQIFLFIIVLIISSIITYFSDVKYLFSTLLLSSAIYLFLNSLYDFKKKNIKLPQKISHLSFSALILSIILNGFFSKEINSNMRVGDEIKFKNKIIKFESIELDSVDNYNSLKGNFAIIEPGEKTLSLKPEIRIYNEPIISTSEADIKTSFFSDNFLVFTLIKDQKIFNVRYQQKPLMLWIWVSTIFLAFGGVLYFVRK